MQQNCRGLPIGGTRTHGQLTNKIIVMLGGTAARAKSGTSVCWLPGVAANGVAVWP